MNTKPARVGEGGKLIIPAPIRREMGIDIGDTVVLELVDGELKVRSRKAALRRVQDRMRQFGPGSVAVAPASEGDVPAAGQEQADD